MRISISFMISSLIISSQASSQSFEQFERARQFERAMVAVDQIRNRNRYQCLMSIKNLSLCECLSETFPVTLHVRNYVSIANQDKGTADYGQLSIADRQIVDQCIAQSSAKTSR
jgi:hypothetical protein